MQWWSIRELNQRVAQERELKRLEKHLHRESENARHLTNMFLTETTNEMRNPIAGQIHALNELLRPDDGLLAPIFGSIPAEAIELLELMRTRGQHLQRMLDDLSSLGQLQVGSLSLHPAPTNLRQLLVDCVSMLDAVAQETDN